MVECQQEEAGATGMRPAASTALLTTMEVIDRLIMRVLLVQFRTAGIDKGKPSATKLIAAGHRKLAAVRMRQSLGQSQADWPS